MEGLQMLAEATRNGRGARGAGTGRKRRRGDDKPLDPQQAGLAAQNELLAQHAQTSAQIQSLLQENSNLARQRRDLAISTSAAAADAVAPPVPKSLNRDSRSVLLKIFNAHEQNSVLTQQQMRCVSRSAALTASDWNCWPFPAQRYPFQAPPGVEGASGESCLIPCGAIC